MLDTFTGALVEAAIDPDREWAVQRPNRGMSLRIGSLFSGYGGLDMAVQNFYGGELAWYSEIDKHANTILAAHYPQVPNLGDIKSVNWADVPPVDILTGGYPCQPFSHAGARKGKDDERHLWPYVRDAIAALRPGVAVLENVDGHRSLGFADVLADIAEMGMSARWGVVRAADAGAPHGRKRIFIIVTNADGAGLQGSHDPAGTAPTRSDGHTQSGFDGPAADADDAAGTQRDKRQAAGRGVQLGDDASGRDLLGGDRIGWGKYGPAISRWERVSGRSAPEPTIPGANGRPRLSPIFVEWMMGLPAGHVTGHGLRPSACLKILGNGVVPQQAALALRMLEAS